MLPIEKDTVDTMQGLAIHVDGVLNQGLYARKYGFAILVFPFISDPAEKAAHYISNAKREDIIKALREKADVLEAGMDIPAGGEQQ